MVPTPLHLALAQFLGVTLTPEVAARIVELAHEQPDDSHDPAKFGLGEYRGYAFRAERFDAVLAELHALHVAHWSETERARDGLPLDPDYDYLRAAERAGRMVQFTARFDGALVGNARFYTYRDLHTKTQAAKEDTFYVLPEHRKGYMALRFWQFAEVGLASIGVQEIRTDSKVLRDRAGNIVRNVGRLNEYLGYEHVSNGYLKRLRSNDG